jgi:hypothetical protein
MAAIDQCAALETCLADAVCAPIWDAFVACEKSGQSFPTCINMLTAGSGELTIKGAAYCEKACYGVDAACSQKAPTSCFDCCKAAHPDGYSGFQLVYYGCACESADCHDTEMCASTNPVTPACVAYLDEQQLTPSSNPCMGSKACASSGCAPFAACIAGCTGG